MRNLFLVLISGVMIVSCSKGTLPEENYFGKVGVALVGLPNTPDIEVHLNGKKLGDVILPGGSRSFEVLSQDGKLEIFKAHSDTLLGDTMISIPANNSRDFRFAYSEAFGLKGFITGGDIAADSVKVQFLNNLGDYYNAYSSLDLHIGYRDIINGGYAETGIVIKDFTRSQLHRETATLPVAWPDGAPYRFYGRLKDVATGAFIITPGRSLDWFVITAFDNGGATHVVRVYDVAGSIRVEVIPI